MNNIEQNKIQLLNLIDTYLEGKATASENNKLINYFESFQKEHGWNVTLGSKEDTKTKMLLRLQAALNKEENDTKETAVIKLNSKKKVYLIYAVAASIVLLISVTFLFNNKNTQPITPVIVDNNIEIGTDKATLTLENGSEIALEKGQNYQTKNLNSNGEKLVYNSDDNSKSEIAYNYLTIPRGGQYHIKLSDGTEVWLNSESKLKYPVAFNEGETRKVELVYGEAYFDVSPSTDHQGDKFKVTTGVQEVEVLGTEFNIKAYQDEDKIYTTLVEGRVTVDFDDNSQILVPNEQSNLSLDTNTLSVEVVDVYDVTSWKNGVFSFKRKSLKEITKVLSRWYDVDFVFINNQVQDAKFMGVLSKKQPLEEILMTIKNTNFIESYQIDHKTIIIK